MPVTAPSCDEAELRVTISEVHVFGYGSSDDAGDSTDSSEDGIGVAYEALDCPCAVLEARKQDIEEGSDDRAGPEAGRPGKGKEDDGTGKVSSKEDRADTDAGRPGPVQEKFDDRAEDDEVEHWWSS